MKYRVTFNGFGAHNTLYKAMTVMINTVYDINRLDDIEDLFYIIQEEIQKHFYKYKILKIEVV